MSDGGPIAGLRVVELAGIGPAPFAAMLLADLGADVLRVDRVGGSPAGLLARGRPAVALDLKNPLGAQAILRVVERADVLVEGFRPGVAERLGVGPDDCLARNAALVYGRMTGWGQDGPWSTRAGHDINYIGLTGVLDAIGPGGGRPTVPLNVVGDFGGGGMLLAVGVLAAVLHARATGVGQVVDAAIVDGTALLATMFQGLLADGRHQLRRGANVFDGGAPFYDTYECRDGRYVAVGALEPAFYAELLAGLGLDATTLPDRDDPTQWDSLRKQFAEAFAQRDRDGWAEVFADTDACVTPVLSFAEAPTHPHNAQRGSYVDVEGVCRPAPAPRFSTTPLTRESQKSLPDWGFSPDEIAELGGGAR